MHLMNIYIYFKSRGKSKFLVDKSAGLWQGFKIDPLGVRNFHGKFKSDKWALMDSVTLVFVLGAQV